MSFSRPQGRIFCCHRTLETLLTTHCFRYASRRRGTRQPAIKLPRLTTLSFCRSSPSHFRSYQRGLGCGRPHLRHSGADLLRSFGRYSCKFCRRARDLGSLRAGGATWLLQTSEDSSLVQRRGRWLTQKVMEIYIQEVSATQFIHNLPHNTKQRILQLVGCFQRTLCLAERWDASRKAPSVWFSLFAYSK